MNDVQLVISPQSVTSQNEIQAVIALQRRGEIVQAKKKARQLVEQFSQCAGTLYLNYQLAFADNDYIDAEHYLKETLELQPEQPLLWLNYAQLILSNYRYSSAVEFANKAVALYSGNNTDFLKAAANVMMQAEKPTLAIPVFQRMLTVEPGNVQFMHQLALCYFFVNKTVEAADLLNQIITKTPDNAGAIHLRSALQSYTPKDNHIDELQKLTTAVVSPHPAIYYALAKELEDVADYTRSFAVLKQGAALMRKHIKYNEAVELESINGIIAATTDMDIAATSEQKIGPVFIVGMPRTGTTLVERVLAQYDDVYSLGEFSLFPQLLSSMANEYMQQNPKDVSTLHEAALRLDFAELGRRYMAAATEVSGGITCVIDKLPVNFLYCGFIKKALPNAKIIHLRRNAMDSCYAIFKTLFINTYSYSYDLDELANYYITYRKIMVHWHKVMPEQILDIQYEDLVTAPVATAKRLTQWCGMTFKQELLELHDTKSTTASAAQVRKPVYTSSVDKWRNVHMELETLRVKLQQAGL